MKISPLSFDGGEQDLCIILKRNLFQPRGAVPLVKDSIISVPEFVILLSFLQKRTNE